MFVVHLIISVMFREKGFVLEGHVERYYQDVIRRCTWSARPLTTTAPTRGRRGGDRHASPVFAPLDSRFSESGPRLEISENLAMTNDESRANAYATAQVTQ